MTFEAAQRPKKLQTQVNIDGNFIYVEMVGVDENGIFVLPEANRGENANGNKNYLDEPSSSRLI